MIHLRASLLNNSLLKIHLKFMRFCGLVTFDDQQHLIVRKCQGLLILINLTILLIGQIIDLYQVFGDIDKMTTNAPPTFIIGIVVVQCYKLMYFSSDLTSILFNDIATNLNNITNSTGDNAKDQQNITNIIKKYTRNSNTLTIMFSMLSIIYLHLGIALSVWRYLQARVLDDDEQRGRINLLIVRSWYPVDIYDNFVIILIFQIIGCYSGMAILPLIYTLIVMYMNYIITMLEILNYRCETLTDNIDDIETMAERDRILKQKLISIVTTHLELGRFVQNLNKLFSTFMFYIFTIFSVLLCALLFQVEFGDDKLIPINGIVNIIVILLMIYWHANEIKYLSDLSTSIYFCNWYACSYKFQKLILIFMSYSNRPLTLSALYFTMDLDVLIKILKTSYSYFTLLLNIADHH